MDDTHAVNNDGRFLSTDSDDFWLEEPGDHTVRPCPPYLLEHSKAERAKIQAALAEAAEKDRKSVKPAEPA
jgi:hypothetical protein